MCQKRKASELNCETNHDDDDELPFKWRKITILNREMIKYNLDISFILPLSDYVNILEPIIEIIVYILSMTFLKSLDPFLYVSEERISHNQMILLKASSMIP